MDVGRKRGRGGEKNATQKSKGNYHLRVGGGVQGRIIVRSREGLQMRILV